MGIEFFRVNVIILQTIAVWTYYSGLASLFETSLEVECYRIDDKVAFFHLQDLAFVYGIGISLMGLIPTDKIGIPYSSLTKDL